MRFKHVCFLTTLTLCASQAARADRPWVVGEHGDFSRIEFRGNESFSAGKLVAALDSDFALLSPSRPLSSLATLLRTMEAELTRGYRHQGFADAQIGVQFDETQQRIVVDINEGEQFKNGPIVVTGVEDNLSRFLTDRLAQDCKPAGPGVVPNADSPQALQASMLTAQQQLAVWRDDEPTSFAPSTQQQIQQRVIETLQQAGYLDAAATVELLPDITTGRTQLHITAVPGPAASIGAIEVVGAVRHTPDEIEEYLAIAIGQSCDLFARRRWEQQLEASGRFAIHTVTSQPLPNQPGRHAVRIELNECEEVPTLAEELSEVDLAMLRACDWLAHPENFEGDVCIHGQGNLRTLVGYIVTDPAAEPVDQVPDAAHGGETPATLPAWLDESRLTFDLYVSPQGSSWLELSVLSRDGRTLFGYGLELSAGRTSLWSTANRNSLEIVTDDGPLPSANITFIRTPTTPDGHKYSMTFGVGVSSEAGGVLQIRMTPAFVLTQAHSETARCEIRDGVLYADWEGVSSQFEAATGRLIRCECDAEDGSSLTVDIGSFSARAVEISRGLDGVEFTDLNRGQPTAIALGEFLSEEIAWWARALGHEAEGERWNAVTRLLRGIDEHDNFETVGFTTMGGEEEFFIPPGDAQQGNPLSWVGAIVLWANTAVLSRGSPAWQVGREAVAAMILNDPTGLAELERLSRDQRCGPLTSLYAAELLQFVHPALAEAWADHGLRRLDAESLERDLLALASPDTLVGQFLTRGMSELGRLPEAELQAVFAGIGEGWLPRVIEISSNADLPPDARVRQLMHLLWDAGLRDLVERRLTDHSRSGMETTQR